MNYQEVAIVFSLFSLGLFGGISHCVGMCGPFVLTQVSNKLSKIDIKSVNNFKKLSGLALLPYHFGRITTYCLIGFVSCLLSINLRNASSFKAASGFLLLIAALIIFNSTIAKIKLPFKIEFVSAGRVSQVSSIVFNFLNQKFRQKSKNLVSFLFLNPVGLKGYLLGVFLGFIPCGLLYGAIATASSLDNSLIAICAMFAFGLGTIPSLFLTACGSYWFFNGIKKHFKFFTKTILLINVITLLLMAFGLIFNQI